MCPLPYMMYSMITILPAFMIIGSIQADDIACKIVIRFIRVNECVLGPIPKHHHKTCKDERNNQYGQRSFQIQKAKGSNDHNKSYFTNRHSSAHFFSFSPHQVKERIVQTKKH